MVSKKPQERPWEAALNIWSLGPQLRDNFDNGHWQSVGLI